MDTNLNIAACIEHTNNFGSTVTHNICNGTTQVVPWGNLDWFLAASGIGVSIFIALFIGLFFSAVAHDLLR